MESLLQTFQRRIPQMAGMCQVYEMDNLVSSWKVLPTLVFMCANRKEYVDKLSNYVSNNVLIKMTLSYRGQCMGTVQN